MNTNEEIMNIVMDTLQGCEYCLNNDGAWNTPEGRADILADLEKVKDVLENAVYLVTKTIERHSSIPNFPVDWKTEWQPSFEEAAQEQKA